MLTKFFKSLIVKMGASPKPALTQKSYNPLNVCGSFTTVKGVITAFQKRMPDSALDTLNRDGLI
jgi:hypothetical protein